VSQACLSKVEYNKTKDCEAIAGFLWGLTPPSRDGCGLKGGILRAAANPLSKEAVALRAAANPFGSTLTYDHT